jgi:PiT family inorganic phosphate transporter
MGVAALRSDSDSVITALDEITPSWLTGMLLRAGESFGRVVGIDMDVGDSTPRRVDGWFRRLQLLSAAAYSLGHGANDAQKTMGIIAGVLLTSGYIATFHIPFWVIMAAHAAIALGTLTGGWRIVKTMGSKITALRPIGGFAAESAAAVCLFGLAWNGIPVSTTHTITGSIIGVGSTRRLTAVRWGVTKSIVWAWIITIPASAGIAALAYEILSNLATG